MENEQWRRVENKPVDLFKRNTLVCDNKIGKIVAMIFVSKYMLKKYGFEKAMKRIAKYKYKYADGKIVKNYE